MPNEAPRLYPSMRYRDAPAAIAFLEEAFGFKRREVIANEDGTIAHAELTLGPSILMLGSDREDPLSGSRIGLGWMYVAVDDADAHHDRARGAGAEVVVELHDTDYGSRDYAARDLEGNLWYFGTYRPSAEQATAASGVSDQVS
jgi:uncharacterized glyoxalase superfamily protein PhnB